jgi:hypothetical protein
VVTIRSKNCHGLKLVKDAAKKRLSDGIKKNFNSGTAALKSKGITLKSNISFVSVYLQ